MDSAKDLEKIRKWLLEQIETTFPEENKEEGKQQILSMNDGQLIEFLKQNNLIKNSEEDMEEQKCVFCSIALNEIPSVILQENDKAIAILDINPVSEGHSLIIPKEHISKIEDFPEEGKKLAIQISEKLQKQLHPKKTEIIPSEAMGHIILNVFPTYNEETLASQRARKSPQELKELKEKIIPSEEKTEIIKEESLSPIQEFNEKNFWLPKRKP